MIIGWPIWSGTRRETELGLRPEIWNTKQNDRPERRLGRLRKTWSFKPINYERYMITVIVIAVAVVLLWGIISALYD